MTDASLANGAYALRKERSESIRLPKPQVLGAPVFINDCVTPLAGETMLSLIMQRIMKDDQPYVG